MIKTFQANYIDLILVWFSWYLPLLPAQDFLLTKIENPFLKSKYFLGTTFPEPTTISSQSGNAIFYLKEIEDPLRYYVLYLLMSCSSCFNTTDNTSLQLEWQLKRQNCSSKAFERMQVMKNSLSCSTWKHFEPFRLPLIQLAV